jgi:type VI secretion system protein ImpA
MSRKQPAQRPAADKALVKGGTHHERHPPVSGTPHHDRQTPARGAPHHDWLAPVSQAAPCGPDLEYDHDFVVLFASAASRQDVQYGAFVGSPDPVNWSEVERDCRRLMLRTKDIRVAVLYSRCRTRLAGAAGLAEGTGLLAAWLQAFAGQVHPQSEDGDGDEHDAALEMRMNALQGLADPEGLLADVREIVLTKSTLARLQVRDVERAFAHPRATDALAPESVAQQLQDLRAQQPSAMTGFDDAIANLAAIGVWCAGHLADYQPDLSPLTRLLGKLGAPVPVTAAEPVGKSGEPVPAMNEPLEHDAAVRSDAVNVATAGMVPPEVAPTGVAPTGVAPTGVAPTGAAPTGDAPTGVTPTGAAPTGDAPTGVTPTGAAPIGVAPTGVTPTGVAPPGVTRASVESVSVPPVSVPPVRVPDHTPAQSVSAPVDRGAALALIRTARIWFETHEPSSPIPVLLKRAEHFVGKRYAETVGAIPAELLAQWEEAEAVAVGRDG